MFAVGDLFYTHTSWGVPAGWYIVKSIRDRGCVVIDIIDGSTNYIDFRTLHRHIRERHSRSDLEVHHRRSHVVHRYFELMGMTERINWITEGF